MCNKILIIISLLLLTSCFEENARNQENITKVYFEESAQKEVLQDVYKAQLRYQIIGQDSIKLQNEINKKMNFAIDVTKSKEILQVSTQNYNVSQYWDRNLKAYSGFKAFQTIILQSKNKEILLDATKKLQESGFIMDNLSSYLSTEKQASYRNELIKEALQRVKERAQIIADNLNKKEITIAEIHVNDNNHQPPIMAMRTMAIESQKSFSAPVVKAQKQDVVIKIKVTANLKN